MVRYVTYKKKTIKQFSHKKILKNSYVIAVQLFFYYFYSCLIAMNYYCLLICIEYNVYFMWRENKNDLYFQSWKLVFSCYQLMTHGVKYVFVFILFLFYVKDIWKFTSEWIIQSVTLNKIVKCHTNLRKFSKNVGS